MVDWLAGWLVGWSMGVGEKIFPILILITDDFFLLVVV